MSRAQFFLMMYGTLAIVVVLFSLIAFYIITRPNFSVHGADELDTDGSGESEADVIEIKTDDTESPPGPKDSSET